MSTQWFTVRRRFEAALGGWFCGCTRVNFREQILC
jgi:hypothetical protein